MRVGVYIDGFNLYYGGRDLCGRGIGGWRWLDVRRLAQDLIDRRNDWSDARIERVIYCTARIQASTNPTGHREQDVYLKALQKGNAVDWIEYGHYVSRVKRAPLAVEDRKGRPVLTRPEWPLKVQDGSGHPVPDARFIVSVAKREEKGSDVNVAAHLLLDVMQGNIDCAIVISNDSDLRLPIQEARTRIPVGTVNPSRAHLAGDLRGRPDDGVGAHWWVQLKAGDFRRNQLPNPCGGQTKPSPW